MTLVGQIALSEICLHISDKAAEGYAGIRRRTSRYDDFLSRCRDQPVANSVPDTQPSAFARATIHRETPADGSLTR